ncbi:hypothetical protein [Paraburkholderia diazotrophica]|uniref:hypothetical protein n=1 Tax=Paraburkholderia diazotrophica TaxID=667676 RepID=UPI00115FF231|nr:hypothetical protein [Paraburkholderia diazotrophica]
MPAKQEHISLDDHDPVDVSDGTFDMEAALALVKTRLALAESDAGAVLSLCAVTRIPTVCSTRVGCGRTARASPEH